MKAVVLHEYGGPDKLRFEDVPDPVPGEREVLVRTTATSVNPIDWKRRSGVMKQMFPLQFPAILGRDVSGTVLMLGDGVVGFEIGDRVMAAANETYAEKVVVKAEELTKIPDELDIVDAAALPLACLTGRQLILEGVKPEGGWTVLVSGAVGSVGRAAVFTAKEAGVKVLAGVCRSQRAEAEALGVEGIVILDDADAVKKLGFLDAVADTTGGKTAETLLGKVKQGGVFATVAGAPANAVAHPTVRVQAVLSHPDAKALREMADAVVAKRFAIPIDRMLPLREAADGQRAAEKGGIGKVLLLA